MKKQKLKDRGETFVGFRPVVFREGKYDKKRSREESKRLCRLATNKEEEINK